MSRSSGLLQRVVRCLVRCPAFAVIGLLGAYKRLLSPLLPPACRFQPTCSEYAQEAIRRHGLLRGAWLALRRVLRCNPWGGHGHDPVP